MCWIYLFNCTIFCGRFHVGDYVACTFLYCVCNLYDFDFIVYLLYIVNIFVRRFVLKLGIKRHSLFVDLFVDVYIRAIYLIC